MSGLVILTMARSRSSMTAEIFKRHGVFFGDTWLREDGRIGYNEHKWIKERSKNRPLYRSLLGQDYRDPELYIGNAQSWIEELRENGWDGVSPWGCKVDAFCHNAFKVLDPYYIGLVRNPEDTAESAYRVLSTSLPISMEDWYKIISMHHDRMRNLGIDMIDTDQLVKGDYAEIELCLDKLGMGFMPEIADEVIGEGKLN